MRHTQEKLIQALDRVEDFLEENKEIMDATHTAEARRFFSAHRAAMAQHSEAQAIFKRQARQVVADQRALRVELLRRHMYPIAAVAGAVLPDVGELSALAVPSQPSRLGQLIAAGRGMAEAARKHEAVLLSAGLAPDFIARLVGATDALEKAMKEAVRIRALRVAATAGLRKQGQKARKVLRALDRMVEAAVATGDGLLDQWAVIRRVAPVGTPSSTVDTTPGEQPTPAPAGPGVIGTIAGPVAEVRDAA